MDRAKLLRLVDKVKAAGYSRGTETVLSIEDYFDGNDERYAGICVNAVDVTTQEFRDFLSSVETKDCVEAVLIRVCDFEDAVEHDDTWITSDTVFVVTSASVDEVGKWFAKLMPSTVGIETDLERFNNLPPIPTGCTLIYLWWD